MAVDFADRVYVFGADKLPYGWDSGLNVSGPGESKLPPPDIQPRIAQPQDREVFSGTSISGHLCFEVAKNEVKTLRLFVKPPRAGLAPTHVQPRWFALR